MIKYAYFLIGIILVSCIDDMDHNKIDTTIQTPDISNKTEITFQELFDLHSDAIGKDTIVTGYVVSSDKEGNFYKEIYVQNTPGVSDLGTVNPRMGMRVRVGLTTTSTKYAKGRKIIVNLEGLKKTTSDDVLTIGQPSNTYIKDIIEFELDAHIFKTEDLVTIEPKTVLIENLAKKDLNTFIKIEDLHFVQTDIGLPYAGLPTDDYDGKRTLVYCEQFRKDEMILETSNFADFAEKEIPNTQLNATGIYTINFDNETVLVLNQFKDIEENGTYIGCSTSNPTILITEIADPKNASFSRYVELYNAENTDIALEGWQLNRFVNGGTESIISLNGLTIPAKGFVIIANDEESTETNLNFEDSFGFTADLVDSRLDGNGDDAYTLTNETGTVVDVFGVTTEDGTDSNWEYEDGRVYRNIDVIQPNEVFTIEEWSVFKDNKNAPIDFSPKERKEDEVAYVPDVVVTETAPLLITEVADPKEETKARFVEIYNPTDNEVSLKDWTLIRYNYTSTKNTKELAALPISLTELTILAKGFVIVTRDKAVFASYFGATADIEASNLDGNGDDAYELIDPFDTLIDAYGDANADGSSSIWEYTDGIAIRKREIDEPNSESIESEWEIVNGDMWSKLEFNYNPRKRWIEE
ncbi:hypothetical protein FHR24_000695 [Wenyingzhuangia heitensis]|uniref:LTD domain-containing protein n=1 Tax=Wenyingzhuangia heitensis TaxID=1487859 RepID=A0ABX0U9K9_9FLAO|nr:DUF5689 domain-containing protein [Wenyingzhuangia heitensis]NIJ44256.1 hypothetical protein [Wenyingzhuangia heitensis]